jgi:hypothetical protein
MKQETLEEAAKKFYPPTTTDLICSPKLVRDAFIAGGKHTAERMYSEDDLQTAFQLGRTYEYSNHESTNQLEIVQYLNSLKSKKV